MITNRPRGFYLFIAMLCIVITLISCYWISFFMTGDVQVANKEIYLTFQNAFPLADGLIALAALISMIGLFLKKSYGVLFSLMAGAGLLIIFFMDVTFNLITHNYSLTSSSSAMFVEVIVNFLCLSFGITLICYPWFNRDKLIK